jgi:1,4-alpha-glucan branching enzyme
VDVGDREQSIISFVRRDGDQHAVVLLNLTPVPREQYRIGAPARGAYRYALSSDDAAFGGSGFDRGDVVQTEDQPYHGFEQSVLLTLPPLSAIVLLPEPGTVEGAETVKSVEQLPAGAQVAVPNELLSDRLPKRLAGKSPKKTDGKKAKPRKRTKRDPENGG